MEKPDLENAKKYLQEGVFLECGYVCLATGGYFTIFVHAPGLSSGLESLSAAWQEFGSVIQAMDTVYPKLEKISIDFAVMEKAEGVVMLESAFDRDDVGEWTQLPAIIHPMIMEMCLKEMDCPGCAGNLAYAESYHTISLLGVKDPIVVQSGDATMVCHKDYAQQVKAPAQQVCQDNPKLA